MLLLFFIVGVIIYLEVIIENIEKKIKKTFNLSLVSSIIFVIVGLFLFIKPGTAISIISYVTGGVLLLMGLISVYKYFTSYSAINLFGFELAYGVLLIISGLFLVIDTSIFAKVINVILGIWIIVNSITKFQYGFVLKRAKNCDWLYTILVSLLSFIWGIVLLINPFSSALTITQIIGIFIIVYAVLDIIDNFIIRRNIKDILSIFKE